MEGESKFQKLVIYYGINTQLKKMHWTACQKLITYTLLTNELFDVKLSYFLQFFLQTFNIFVCVKI